MFKHWGRTFGQGAVEVGALGEVEVVTTPAGVEEACCSHFVQMVLMLVIKIVLVETPTLVVVRPLEV